MDGTVLNADSILEIMKYVIIDCQLNEGRHVEMGIVDFNDLINFVLAHEFFVELLADHHKILYKDLELALACRTIKLLIDLRVNKQSKNEEIFWRSFLESVREKSPFDLQLSFQGLYVHIKITGISSGRTHQETLKFDLTLNADALADILSSNQNLTKLSFESTEVHGDLSDIIPHCANIEELRITLNAGDVASQYEPLVNLPNLKNILVTGLQRSESESLFFSNLKKWHRPSSLPPLTLKIEDYLTDIHRPITFATFNSLRCFRVNETKAYYERKYKWKWNAIFRAEYDLSAMKDDSSSIEDSLATIRLGEGVKIKFIWSEGKLELKLHDNSDISQMGSLSKLPNLTRLVVQNKTYCLENPDSLAKFLRSMGPNGSFALKSCKINYAGLHQTEIEELTKIKSLRFLACHLHDVPDINFSQMTNLQHIKLNFRQNFITSNVIHNLLSKCQVQATIFSEDVTITLLRAEKRLEIHLCNCENTDFAIPLAKLKDINTLVISGRQKLEYLNTIFDAFAANLSTIEELNLSELRPYRSELKGVRFKDISKVTEIQTIRSLRCCVSDVTGVQKLADLNKLENLEIYHSGDGNLIELLTKLAEKNTIKCIKTGKLTHEEVLKITQMRSMKTLVSRLLNEDDLKFFAELANSSIEEIIIMEYNNSIWVTPSLFYTIRARQLGHFDIWHKKLNFIETVDVSKITGLKRLCAGFVDAECAEILDRLPQLEDLTIGFIKTPLETLLRVIALKSPMTLKKLELCNWIGGSECECLTQFETLESLTCSLRNEMGIDHLANIQNLKELLIHRDSAPLTNLFRAFAQKSDSKLEKLQAPVTCSAEIREISQIKSLKTLNVDLTKMCDNLSNLSRLNELKSLSIIDSCGCKLNSDSCLSIFRYCQKLNRVDLGFYYGVALDLVSQVNNVLKSIRDPANQKPLKLSIFSVSIYPKIHVEDIDESILNVSYSYETKMGAVEIEFNSDNEDSDDSDSFDYD
ncbi:uncharacterized protein LOC26535293 [Drosophila yakuba]|uniref:Uncharacterized protein, isoform A n=1 Tax=Drosophila yakuba TaxID=7245 RepID=A0A0R1DP75_DROYA|nr:uncharacterized protein LOC26535293 [Drosophila yakuba]XP_015052896.1 uncharacterized protein LOC26535293 [Drosophila yakuba]XP_039229161.1 uncharacterized protein LOC26535293 [Drosophila yakuba]KRJ99080.1 uncharacterized protein Dyak_GE28112, isoform A [Drosophila yakuba]KRJ99082.1 uncharacterized protein Dyak_GE28112, isoform C [Drosophila yakuba]